MSPYRDYYLSSNPFPSTPILNPTSDDDRINGTIFNSEIMAEAIRSFQDKISRRPPLIYVENRTFVRGVGKSALIVQHWRQLKKDERVTSIYIRSERLKPTDFAARFIRQWHQDGYLWPVVLKTLAAYTEENPGGEITPVGAQVFAQAFPKLPLRTISLLNFNVFNPDQLITDLAVWAQRHIGGGLHFELARIFFESYLTDPGAFLDTYSGVLRKYKWDNITMLGAMYRLMKLGGCEHHYLFLDQFEDVVHGLSGKSLITFSTEMRRLVEASIGRATLIVSVHSGARTALNSHECGDISSMAPPDERHIVEVGVVSQEAASPLAQIYLDRFRLTDLSPPNALYPFTTEAIEEVYKAAEGNIRTCLQALNYAIEKGISVGWPVIDIDFLVRYHRDITGRAHVEEVNL